MKYLALLCFVFVGCGCEHDDKMIATGVVEQIFFDRDRPTYVSVFKTYSDRIVLYTDWEQPKDWGRLEIGKSYTIEYRDTDLLSAIPVDLEASGPEIYTSLDK